MVRGAPETFRDYWPGLAVPTVPRGVFLDFVICPVSVCAPALLVPVPAGLPHLSQELSNMGTSMCRDRGVDSCCPHPQGAAGKSNREDKVKISQMARKEK